MSLTLRVMAPNRTVWDSKADEIILSTNSGQVGILPGHASLLTALDIGILRVKTTTQWDTMALMGGFAMVDNDRVTVLVNEAERAEQIDLQEAQSAFESSRASLDQAESRRQRIEARLAFRRAKARLEAVRNASAPA